MEKVQGVEEKIRRRQQFDNRVEVRFDAISVNEAFARIVVAAFVAPLNPTLEEISGIKTAVSEAVTNAIIHGYDNAISEERKQVYMECRITEDVLQVMIRDEGKGIEDIEQAMQPLFTTKPELERSGMGFAFMEAFMDDLEIESAPGSGTTIIMKKKLGVSPWLFDED